MNIFRGQNSLFYCIKHLGLKNGWRYWRLDSYCRKNPDFIPKLIKETRRRVESLEDGPNKQIGLNFVNNWENIFEQWKS